MNGRFGIRHGLVCFALFIAGQLLVWLAAAILAITRIGVEAPVDAFEAELLRIAPVVLALSVAFGALLLGLGLRRYATRFGVEELPAAFGLTRGRWADLAIGAATGVALAILYIASAPLLATAESGGSGMLATMFTGGGPGRLVWLYAAVLIGATAEEVLFRGVLLHAFRARMTLVAACMTAGVLFWVLHLPEAASFWPAALAIAILAWLTTVLRLRTGGLGAPILAHIGYNLTLVTVVLVLR